MHPVASLRREPSSVDSLREEAKRGRLFAVLDACDADYVPPMVDALGPNGVSLYIGTAAEEFRDVAPYLVRVDEVDLEWIASYVAPRDEAWGIFLLAGASLEELRGHLRRFLRVEDAEGRKLYFRFYDPRLLPSFLETCTREELATFFGPVRSFGTLAEGRISLYARSDAPAPSIPSPAGGTPGIR